MNVRLLFFIIVISANIFATPIFAQSLFSGLILSEKNDGLNVVDVQKGSPGFDAGLKVGDIVLEIEGKKINSLDNYVKISRKIRNEKVEVSLTIFRKGIRYEAVIKTYSIPIYQNWNEKVAKPTGTPQKLKVSPYEYWVGKGNRALQKSKTQETFETKVTNYTEAIKYLYRGLHYQPESIDTALQIAKSYHTLGKLYLNNGIIKESIKKYKNSIRLYTYCFEKTQKEDYLKLILTSLQEIEKELGEINTKKINSQ